MLSLVVNRLLQSLVVLVAVAFVSFSLFTFLGNPVDKILDAEATNEQRAHLRRSLGLDDPMPVQFIRFLEKAARFDFGISYSEKRKVSSMLAERLPATLELSLLSSAIALVLGILLGIYTALRRDTWISNALLAVTLSGVSLPNFLIGIGLIFIFAVQLPLLPAFGRGTVTDLGFWTTGFLTVSGWQALLLPAVTLSLFQTTFIMRMVRAEMLDVLRTDYIKSARARGLPARTVYFRYALKNILGPIIAIAGLQIGFIIAFSISAETVFQWPGVGLMFIKAVLDNDIPVMAAYLLLIALMFVFINLVVDILQFVIDPRLRKS